MKKDSIASSARMAKVEREISVLRVSLFYYIFLFLEKLTRRTVCAAPLHCQTV